MLRYKTELAWFSRLARKRSGSILITPEPARDGQSDKNQVINVWKIKLLKTATVRQLNALAQYVKTTKPVANCHIGSIIKANKNFVQPCINSRNTT